MHELTLHLQQAGLFKDKLPHRSTMARWIRAALELDGEFTVRFVDEEEGRELNRQFRRKDYATNVLTFDYQREPVVMADIVICPAVLERQAAEQQKPLRDHLAHLLIHGVLHAQGYDHLDDEGGKVDTALIFQRRLPIAFQQFLRSCVERIRYVQKHVQRKIICQPWRFDCAYQ